MKDRIFSDIVSFNGFIVNIFEFFHHGIQFATLFDLTGKKFMVKSEQEKKICKHKIIKRESVTMKPSRKEQSKW